MPAPNLDLGPCVVTWKSTIIGPTKGGVKFKDELQYKEIFTDQQGETPVDGVTTGRKVEIEIPITQASLAILEKVTIGSVKGTSNLKVSNSVGTQMYANSGELILKPFNDNVASTTTSEWLHVHKAYPTTKYEIGYDVDGQRIWKVVFRAFPQVATGAVEEIWRLGPST